METERYFTTLFSLKYPMNFSHSRQRRARLLKKNALTQMHAAVTRHANKSLSQRKAAHNVLPFSKRDLEPSLALQKMECLAAFLAEGGLKDIEPSAEDMESAIALRKKLLQRLLKTEECSALAHDEHELCAVGNPKQF